MRSTCRKRSKMKTTSVHVLPSQARRAERGYIPRRKRLSREPSSPRYQRGRLPITFSLTRSPRSEFHRMFRQQLEFEIPFSARCLFQSRCSPAGGPTHPAVVFSFRQRSSGFVFWDDRALLRLRVLTTIDWTNEWNPGILHRKETNPEFGGRTKRSNVVVHKMIRTGVDPAVDHAAVGSHTQHW